MTELDKLFLAVHTRQEQYADTDDKIRLFSGTEQVAEFQGSVPPRGKVGLLEADVDLNYEEQFATEYHLYLGLTGNNKWGPRSAFLWGHVDAPDQPGTKLLPLASNFYPRALWLSQDVLEGVDRMHLNYHSHLKMPLNGNLNSESPTMFVLYLETSEFDYSKWRPGGGGSEEPTPSSGMVRALPSPDYKTDGPLEFSIYGRIAYGTIRYTPMLFHTVLSQIGSQKPAENGGKYLSYYNLGFNQLTSPLGDCTFRIDSAKIRNCSDDPWYPSKALLFGLHGYRGRLLGIFNVGWTSQWQFMRNVYSSLYASIADSYSVLDYE